MKELRKGNLRPSVLIADDEMEIRKLLEYNLSRAGYDPILTKDGKEAIEAMNDDIAVALIDLKMPGVDGLECLEFIKAHFSHVPVIMISAVSQVKDAVTAIKKGAFEYITKPFELPELISVVQQAVKLGSISRQNIQLKQAVGHSKPIHGFIGESTAAKEILHQIQVVAPLDSTVLITGESGVGKGLLARMIHYASPRAQGPFISVSCPSLPRELLESELFGHEKGAFTSAYDQRIGRIEMAHGGTLFLDELGALPLDLQPKLLTFLQERNFQRVGGRKSIEVDVRVIAATNTDLEEKIHHHAFREDLYFRLNVLPIHIPSLKERTEDIPLLCEQTLARISQARNCPPFTLTQDALALIKKYQWPGNVRELENIMERVSAFCSSSLITEHDLAHALTNGRNKASFQMHPPEVGGISLDELERIAIEQTLALCHGNKAEAARRLGITEKSIYNKLDHYKMR